MSGGRDNLRPAPPFEVGNQAALVHGAQSARAVTRATAEKRRLLRAMGLRQSDLAALGRALLDNLAACRVKRKMLDDYFEEKGLLDARGNPRGATRIYTSLVNSERLALKALEGYLREQHYDPTQALADYLASKREYRVANGSADD
jgi:hypothetical protein